MAVYRLLPNIIAKIEQTMIDLGVRPVDPKKTPAAAAAKKSRVYMAPVLTKRGETLWFKSSLQDWAWVRETLREEIRIHRLFGDYEKAARPSFSSPTLITKHDDRHGFVWFLRKYWDALSAGDMNDEFGFSDQFFRRISPSLAARALSDVRDMTGFVRRRFQPSAHQLNWYFRDWEYYRKTFWRPVINHRLNPGWTKADADALTAWLLEQRSLIAKSATVFTHGDLYPNNLMIRPGSARPVVIFDWELSHLNLATFDVIMIYLQAWRRPVWQAEFKKQSVRLLGDTKRTQRLWTIAQLSLATRLGAFAFHRLANTLPERYPPLPKKYRSVVQRMFVAMTRELRQVRGVVG